MTSIIELLRITFQDSTKMVIFNKLRTNDPILDALLSTIILSFILYKHFIHLIFHVEFSDQ